MEVGAFLASRVTVEQKNVWASSFGFWASGSGLWVPDFGFLVSGVQGYLAHKKPPPPKTLP